MTMRSDEVDFQRGELETVITIFILISFLTTSPRKNCGRLRPKWNDAARECFRRFKATAPRRAQVGSPAKPRCTTHKAPQGPACCTICGEPALQAPLGSAMFVVTTTADSSKLRRSGMNSTPFVGSTTSTCCSYGAFGPVQRVWL
jgi:hypothetical protein